MCYAYKKRRCDLLAAINVMVPVIELQFMDTEAFDNFYSEKKTAFDLAEKAKAAEESARKAEAERLAKIAEEQAAKQAEIDRQQAELAKKQAEQQAELDRQKAEIEAKQKAIDDAERAKREKCLGWRTSQLAAVKSSMDQDAMMALSDDEFSVMVHVLREDEAKAEAECIAKAAKEEAERIERERLAEIARKEAESKRIAALAPDIEKIGAYIVAFSDLELPALSSQIVSQRMAQIADDFADELRDLMMVAIEKGTL